MHIHLHLLSLLHSTFIRRLIGALTSAMIALAGYHAFEFGVEILRDRPEVKADVVSENVNGEAFDNIAARARAAMEQR